MFCSVDFGQLGHVFDGRLLRDTNGGSFFSDFGDNTDSGLLSRTLSLRDNGCILLCIRQVAAPFSAEV